MGERQFINLPFAEGLAQQDTLEWQDSAASASGVTNGNFTKQGAIDKRLGMQVLSNALVPFGPPLVPAISSAVRAMAWSRGNLSVASPGYLYSYAPATPGLAGVGQLPPVAVARNPLPSTAVPQDAVSALVPYSAGTLRVTMYVQPAQVTPGAVQLFLTATDAATGNIVLEPVGIRTGATGDTMYVCQVLYVPNAPVASSVVWLMCQTAASTGFKTGYVGTFNPITNLPSGVLIATTQLQDTPDLALFQDYPGGAVVLSYIAATGSAVYDIRTTAMVSLGTSTITTGVSGTGKISFAGSYNDATSLFVWGDGQKVQSEVFNNSILTLQGIIVTVATAPGTQPANTCGVVRISNSQFLTSYWQITGGTSANPGAPITCTGNYYILSNASAVIGSGTIPTGLRPVAAPFFVNGSVYQPAYLTTRLANLGTALTNPPQSEQGTLYLLQMPEVLGLGQTNGNIALPVATIAPRQLDLANLFTMSTGGSQPNAFGDGFHCPYVANYPPVGPTQFSCDIRTVGAGVGAETGPIDAAWSVDFFFDAANQALQLYQPNELGNELRLSGGVPFVADASTTYEASFFMYPEGAFVSDSGSGTWGNTTGAYTWAVCYAYVDGSGLIDRSAPVFTKTITVTNGGTLPQVSIPPLFSWRQKTNAGQLFVETYRTQVNASVFFLVDKVPVSTAGLRVFVDGVADALIGTSSILYTTGGILDQVNPPAAICQTVHWGRLWLVDETAQNIWFSQAFNAGQSPGFNEALTMNFTDGGKITVLASMDDKLLVGKQSGLWVVYGQGPAVTGAGSDITVPQPIATDGGPVDWRSCVVFPGGLIYRSTTGFMLCDRGLNVSWIGKDVVDFLAAYPTVLAATLVPTATQVRFVCANNSGATITLVFDYLVNKWFQHTYPSQSAPVASAVLTVGASPTYSTVTTDGQLWAENTSYYDTNAAGTPVFVPTVVTTAWNKIQGVQGYQRARQVQLLFEEMDDCGITMSFAVNYQSAIVQTYSWPSAVIDRLPNAIVQQHVGGAYMKQLALQVTVSDTPGTNATNGRGARFVGLSLELEALDGRYRQVPSIGKA